MIALENVTFKYKKEQNLFTNLDLDIKRGSIYGLLGKNGAGKTTLLKLITGLLFTQDGKIKIDDFDSYKRQPEFLSKYFLIPEEFDFPNITIDSFLNLYTPFYKKFNTTQFENYISEFEIPHANKLTKMSFGQKKKFLLSFGLATNTEVLIMDEPTNGLDIPSKSQFRKILASAITDDRIFLISTHQVKDIEGIIDHIIILDKGKIKFSENINSISEKISFSKLKDGELIEDILYSESILGGQNAIIKNNNLEYSEIDIELLFNSVISGNNKIINFFDETKLN